MRPADLADLLKGIAIDVREYIAQALAPIAAKQAELEQRVAAIPVEKAEPGPRGASAYEVARDAGFVGTEQEWLASLRGHDGVSVQGERGEDGKSVTVDDIAPLLRDELARQVAEIPRPQDGKSVTADDVRPMVQQLVDMATLAMPKAPTPEEVLQLVEHAVSGIPRPADGKSVTVEDVKPLVAELVEKAVAAIPAPVDGQNGKDGEDGKSVTVEEVRAFLPTVDDLRPVVRELVDGAMAALPVPADGKDGQSVTLDQLRPLVEEAVAGVPVPTVDDLQPVVRDLVDAAVAALPVPADGKDGRSVSLDEVRPLVAEAVAGIAVPTVDDVRPIVRELVDAAAAAIPVPADGKDGVSVTLEDVRPMVERAVAALPKPKDGENVPIEVVAALVAGEVAKAVAALPPAPSGRDAAQIEPLPAIDVTRSYPRGTWAKHERGLWLARTTTDGMAGWDCIVAGVAALELSSDGLRTVTVKSILSDGQSESAEFVLPSMAYRGAWSNGDEYSPGDTVSWDGSMWHCEAKTTDRPASSPNWKLCVKHGRDGKDGVRGPKGERGSDGRPGRDLTQLGFDGKRS